MTKLLHSLGPIGPNYKIISVIGVADAKEFIRILHEITLKTGFWYCYINNSKISQYIGRGVYLELDLNKIIGEKKDMAFILNKKITYEMKTMTGYNELIVIHNKKGGFYTFLNGNMQCQIPENSTENSLVLPPPFAPDQYVGAPVIISKSDLPVIRKYLSKRTLGHLMVYEDQLEQFCITGKQPYTFNIGALGTIVGKKPNLSLLSSNFLSIVGKNKITLKLARNSHGVWLITESMMSLDVEPTTYELLF